jgi:hypothetical protein
MQMIAGRKGMGADFLYLGPFFAVEQERMGS